MDCFFERLLFEKRELEERILKLESFIDDERFALIGEKQQRLLPIQLRLMETYRDILSVRIRDLEDNQDEK